MEHPAEVVVIGNAGVDTNAYLSGPLDLAQETEYPEVLDTVGQSGGYSARGFARLGRRTAYLGYVGDDALGRFLLAELAADGVDVSHALVDPAGTGRSVNLMSPDGRRHGFYDGKSHLSLVPDTGLLAARPGRRAAGALRDPGLGPRGARRRRARPAPWCRWTYRMCATSPTRTAPTSSPPPT